MPFANAKVGSGLRDETNKLSEISSSTTETSAQQNAKSNTSATTQARIRSLRRAFVPKITSIAVLNFIRKERELFRSTSNSADTATTTKQTRKVDESASGDKETNTSSIDSHADQQETGANSSSQFSTRISDTYATDGARPRPIHMLSSAGRTTVEGASVAASASTKPTNTGRRFSEDSSISKRNLVSNLVAKSIIRPGSSDSYLSSKKITSYPSKTDNSITERSSAAEVAKLNSVDRKYLNRTTNGAEAFSLIEMFNSLDEDGDGWLTVEDDMPIAYKMVGVPKHKQPVLVVHKLDTFSFCKVIGELQRQQQTVGDVSDTLGASLRVSRRLIENANLSANADVVLSDSEIDVFLGGACNPTNWRVKEAIPFCTRFGIRFYNPQVDEWHPDLVAVEQRAKVKSKLLLYVITTETRAIASMVEAAELVTSGRNMILVLTDYTTDDAAARGMSVDEMKDLNRGRAYLADVAERHKVPTFEDINIALVEVARRLGVRNSNSWTHRRSASTRV